MRWTLGLLSQRYVFELCYHWSCWMATGNGNETLHVFITRIHQESTMARCLLLGTWSIEVLVTFMDASEYVLDYLPKMH